MTLEGIQGLSHNMQDVKILIAKAEQQLVDVGENASGPPLYYVHVEIMSFHPVIIRVW